MKVSASPPPPLVSTSSPSPLAPTPTNQEEEDNREVYSVDDSEANDPLFSSSVFTSKPYSDLATSQIFYSSQTPAVYNNEAGFKEDEKVIEELREKVNKLPKTSFFDPVKKAINHLVGGIICRAPKEIAPSYQDDLSTLCSECPSLLKSSSDHCYDIKMFFTNNTLPIKSNLEAFEIKFENLNSKYILVKKWIKSQLKFLRKKVLQGTPPKCLLTDVQNNFINYQLRKVLSSDLVKSTREASDKVYSERKNLLESLEKDWDMAALSLQRASDNINICKMFSSTLIDKNILSTFQDVQNKSEQLLADVTALTTTSLNCSYENEFASVITAKMKLWKAFLEFRIQKNSLHLDVQEILKNADRFINPTTEDHSSNSDSEFTHIDASERLLPFLNFMAFPTRSDNVEAKKEIRTTAKGEVIALSKALVTAWNTICLKCIQIEEGLAVTNFILDIYPQLNDLGTKIGSEYNALCTLRKNQDDFYIAVETFKEHSKKFEEFKNKILFKSDYLYSRNDRAFSGKGFKVLYETVINEIKTKEEVLKGKLKEGFDKRHFPIYGIISYDSESDRITCEALKNVCVMLGDFQNEIKKKITDRYDQLKNKEFKNLIFELNRTFDLHTAINQNFNSYFTPVKEKKFIGEKEVEVEAKEKRIIDGREVEVTKLKPVVEKLTKLYGFETTGRFSSWIFTSKFTSPFAEKG